MPATRRKLHSLLIRSASRARKFSSFRATVGDTVISWRGGEQWQRAAQAQSLNDSATYGWLGCFWVRGIFQGFIRFYSSISSTSAGESQYVDALFAASICSLGSAPSCGG